MKVILLAASVLAGVACGFYLPGVSPKEYEDEDVVKIKVEKLDSISTQLPYDYYSLPFCKPNHIHTEAENLGEIISGDSIKNSPYLIKMKKSVDCEVLCRKQYYRHDLIHWTRKITENYRVNLIMDNMPAVQKFKVITTDAKQHEEEDYIYEQGYPIGELAAIRGARVVNLNNHLAINVLTHTDPNYSGSRIVGFEVQPYSIQHKTADAEKWDANAVAKNKVQCTQSDGSPLPPMTISHRHLKKQKRSKLKLPLPVIWTYSVEFTSSPVKWAMRWDTYLKMQDPQIHWFSILNSFMIVVFLSGMVAMILMRALHKDLQRYNSEEDLEASLEDIGWKLVHGDVFRTPESPALFATLIGSGVQVSFMAVLTLVFAALGFLSPANRGSLMTTLLLLYVFMGVLSGYTSARVYKMFGETDWQRQNLLTAFFFPGINFVVFIVLNLLVWHTGSSGAVPFGTLFSLLVLWFGISVPLVYLGAYFGYKKEALAYPCATNELARMIPEQPWYMQKQFVILVGGVLPFGAVFIEVFFIMSSVWLHRYYYMFGFLLLVFCILLLTSAEITIVMTYFQLCAEDWQWWWRSAFTSGSAAVYLFLYSLLYFYTKLDIAPVVSGLLYFGYMFLICFAFFLICATVGFLATFWFVKKIYGAIKVA